MLGWHAPSCTGIEQRDSTRTTTYEYLCDYHVPRGAPLHVTINKKGVLRMNLSGTLVLLFGKLRVLLVLSFRR